MPMQTNERTNQQYQLLLPLNDAFNNVTKWNIEKYDPICDRYIKDCCRLDGYIQQPLDNSDGWSSQPNR